MRLAQLSLPLKRWAASVPKGVLLTLSAAAAIWEVDVHHPVAASLRLSTALIETGKSHEPVVRPNPNLGDSQPQFWNQLRDFFTTNLLGGIPPAYGGAK